MSNRDGFASEESKFLKLEQSKVLNANIYNMSELLNTGLTAETLGICVRLCEAGVNPNALAEVINQIRQEVATSSAENGV